MIWFKDDLNEDELKKEYRRLAKKYHPDLCKDPDAEEKMKEINEQFDNYYVNQRIREFSWVDTYKAKRNAQKIRRTLLVWLRRDKENPGKFFAFVEERWAGFWFWDQGIKIKGVTNDSKDWDGFRGGLAYCGYGDEDDDGCVSLSKLPAKITPASVEEVYFYIRDHFGDSRYTSYCEVECRFGTFIAEELDHGYLFYVKAELPEKFLHIGNVDDNDAAMYAARSINTVYVDSRWIKEAKIGYQEYGNSFAYRLFQDCSEYEFKKWHDVNVTPQYAELVGVKQVKDDFWFIPDPVVSFFARKGIIKIFHAKQNFRIRFGYFDEYKLKTNLHLMSVEDAEAIQDYLDQINQEFDKYVLSLIKKGKIKIKL